MKVTISIKAAHLKNVAGSFKGTSDPFAVITVLPLDPSSPPRVLGKTEVIKNSLNPDWTQSFTIDYTLGKPTNVLIKIYDEVRKGDNKSMGSCVFELGTVLGSKGSIQSKAIPNSRGIIYCKIEEEKDYGNLKLKLAGVKLKNLDGIFNKSDPFYEIQKRDYGKGANWNVVYRSSYIKNDLNPDWDVVSLGLNSVCDGNLDQLIKLTVYDHEGSGKHELMGEIETSVNGLVAAKSHGNGFALKKDGDTTGTILVSVADIINTQDAEDEEIPVAAMSNVKLSPSVPQISLGTKKSGPTFVDYIKGGCEINLSVAIDFTGSNGDPRDPSTLHYIHRDGTFNDYEKAIQKVGKILEKYDSDKKYPVFGFGAKYDGVVRHCFQCGPSEEVDGVDGIINAYRQTFASGLIMSGPTVFTEVIQTAAARAASAQEAAKAQGKQTYSVLLILTDGAVSDVQATARCIDQIDENPLSIVIVGIGSADFSSMQFLDDNSGDIDIAQFVKFNDCKYSQSALTEATLDEIPNQLVKYYLRHGINPNPPEVVEEEEIAVAPAEEEIAVNIDFGADGIPFYGGNSS
jgi:hypothetical protein